MKPRYSSPRGRDSGRPFLQIHKFRRRVGTAGVIYIGEIGGATARIERDPHDPNAITLTIVIRSALTAKRAPRRPRKSGLRREAAMLADAEIEAGE
ncbi:MAG: hypothetical protein JNJ97_11805 [Alphaproteobacteria bacterium]|nr:hypothetical protein [Alphaproteobacteria bacterium]